MRRMYSKPQLLEAVEQESKINGIKVFEDIKDKDGHNRFIEGDGTPATITGFTATYCKWSLSGTHLMFVLAGTCENTITIANGTSLATFDIPQWIFDKIYPVWQNAWIENKVVNAMSSSFTSQSFGVNFKKDTTNMAFIKSGEITLTAERSFRVSFDLLIDNE